jgi:hypothetical protein
MIAHPGRQLYSRSPVVFDGSQLDVEMSTIRPTETSPAHTSVGKCLWPATKSRELRRFSEISTPNRTE